MHQLKHAKDVKIRYHNCVVSIALFYPLRCFLFWRNEQVPLFFVSNSLALASKNWSQLKGPLWLGSNLLVLLNLPFEVLCALLCLSPKEVYFMICFKSHCLLVKLSSLEALSQVWVQPLAIPCLVLNAHAVCFFVCYNITTVISTDIDLRCLLELNHVCGNLRNIWSVV